MISYCTYNGKEGPPVREAQSDIIEDKQTMMIYLCTIEKVVERI